MRPIEAISEAWGQVEKIADELHAIDQLLNPKAGRSVVKMKSVGQFRYLATALLGFVEYLYYLSDGGYSRITLSVENLHCVLTSESTERAKNLWEGEAVQAHVQTILDALSYLSGILNVNADE